MDTILLIVIGCLNIYILMHLKQAHKNNARESAVGAIRHVYLDTRQQLMCGYLFDLDQNDSIEEEVNSIVVEKTQVLKQNVNRVKRNIYRHPLDDMGFDF
jgi:hypothetical protein